MTYQAEVEFVCYHEGGLIDLQRAMDEYLPQTLVKLPPDDESFRTYRDPQPANYDGPFSPSLRLAEIYLGTDDILTQNVNRIPLLTYTLDFIRRVLEGFTEIAKRIPLLRRMFQLAPNPPFESLIPAGPERVFPFQRALESKPISDEETELATKPIVRDRLPQPVMRTAIALPMYQSQQSFHDMLVARSRERQDLRRKQQLANAKLWRNILWKTTVEVLIFGGTVAVAAGALASYRGFSPAKVAGVVVASTLAVASIVIALKFSRQDTKSLANPS